MFPTTLKSSLGLKKSSRDIELLPRSDPYRFLNNTITATLAPHQIYVFFDRSNTSAGFGSYSGGPGYPLTLSSNNANYDAQLLDAISDIILNPADSGNYLPETTTIEGLADLEHPIVLADLASSCTSLDPVSGHCTSINAPAKLVTDHGDLYLFEPYTLIDNSQSPYPYRITRASFGLV